MAPAASSCLQLQPLNNFGWSRGPAASARFNISSHGLVESASADATSSPGLVTISPAPSLCTIRHICYHATELARSRHELLHRADDEAATELLLVASLLVSRPPAVTIRKDVEEQCGLSAHENNATLGGHNALPTAFGTGPGSNYLAFPQHSLFNHVHHTSRRLWPLDFLSCQTGAPARLFYESSYTEHSRSSPVHAADSALA